MLKAFKFFGRTVSLWWREWMHFTLLNLAWLALQVTIIAGPPATAAMYIVARRVADDEYLDMGYYWQMLRPMFWPAWKWGAVNLLVVVALVGNFWFYQSTNGPLAIVLRVVWATIALYWFIANLFYWPFWLAQEDHRMLITYRNCLLLLAKRPVLILTISVLCAVLIVASILTTLPLAVLLMIRLAFIGVLVVKDEVERTTKLDQNTD